jgi:integrase
MEILPRNVAKNQNPPRPKRKEVEPLIREDVGKLLREAYHTEFYYPLMVAVFTGLRRSELLALTWKDINLEERYLSVNKGLHTNSSDDERYQPPKTEKSKRRVSLPNDLVLALRHYRDTQEAVRDQLGVEFAPETPLFARADDSMMHPDSLSKACVRLAKKAGLVGVHLHSLRHTMASMLIEQGEYPKVISERLGHASSAFTNDVYGHLMPGMERAAADKMDVALEGVISTPE